MKFSHSLALLPENGFISLFFGIIASIGYPGFPFVCLRFANLGSIRKGGSFPKEE